MVQFQKLIGQDKCNIGSKSGVNLELMSAKRAHDEYKSVGQLDDPPTDASYFDHRHLQVRST